MVQSYHWCVLEANTLHPPIVLRHSKIKLTILMTNHSKLVLITHISKEQYLPQSKLAMYFEEHVNCLPGILTTI